LGFNESILKQVNDQGLTVYIEFDGDFVKLIAEKGINLKKKSDQLLAIVLQHGENFPENLIN